MANASACPSQFSKKIKKNREVLQDYSSQKAQRFFNPLICPLAGRVVSSDPGRSPFGPAAGRNNSGAMMKK
jgi:hypothetical protein